ncbi:hypothetical protein DM860_014709 [Cuscuta australis]|uniref:Pentacotripeptide-repeat region of PRORP domain-containing protein n=1 Tax=Cuscuta australis TaxID=267555 RepID=A0A328DLT4_9ASTE|nr:hypothetical protein DM860_014709 [Cuscuta australis]
MMGLLNRLGLGLRRLQPAALRRGWNRYCHTTITNISRPVGSTISLVANHKIYAKSALDDGVIDQEKQASVVDFNWTMDEDEDDDDEEDEDEKQLYQSHKRANERMETLWWLITHLFIRDERFDVKSLLDFRVKREKGLLEGGLKRILRRLRKDGRYSLALEISEWMGEKGYFRFSSRDHACQINLIGKVRGCSAAERYVKNLPEQARNDTAYRELLHCYVHAHRAEKALFHFQKMKELGFLSSPRPFNEIMRLYAKSLQIEKVLGVMAEMKKSKVSPDNDSYRICISSFGLTYDVDGMERMLREMESQPHIVMDWCTYAVVAQFYERAVFVEKAADALKKAEVILQKKKKKNRGSHNLINSDYENVIKSLVKLGELDEAMKFAKEWEALGNWRTVDDISIPYIIIEGYIKKGSLRKALYRIWEWDRKGKTGVDKLSRLLCNEYLKVGNLFKAYDYCFVVRDRALGSLVVQRAFLQYIEEECGLFFPLRCSGSFCCSRSLKTDAGKTFLELTPINAKYKIKVPLLVHSENPTQEVNKDYENIIKSLVESGELDEARKRATEWEASGNLSSLDALNLSKLIIEGCCKKSLFVEAEAMAEAWTREKRCWVAGIWLILACHYQEEGKLVRGFECMRRFVCLAPWLKRRGNQLAFKMLGYVIEYSRGMNGAGHYFKSRRYDLSDLNEVLSRIN